MAPNPQVLPTGTVPGGVDINLNSSLSDRVAIAAAVLAAAAFIIAFLQLVYAYWTSDLRAKCSSGGIGGWNLYTKTNWELHGCIWTARVVYPQIDLRVETILRERFSAELHLPTFKSLPPGYGWADRSYFENANELGFWHIWYGTSVFNDGDENFVKVFDLPWRAQIHWFLYLYKNPREEFGGARASWANLLACLRVVPATSKGLVLSRQRADVIPAGMDAPLQTTTLANMGLLCFLLGLKYVTIDINKGTIFARNDLARIRTSNLNIPGAENVVTFEGDIDSLRGRCAQPATSELVEAASWANGKLEFIKINVNPYVFEPLSILYALQNEWNEDKWKAYTILRRMRESPSGPGNLVWEAREYKDQRAHSDDEADAIEGKDAWNMFWTKLDIGACPSLIQMLPFLSYHSIVSGFPLEAYLSPFDEHLLWDNATWWGSGGEQLCQSDASLYGRASRNQIPFLRKHSDFLMVAGVVTGDSGCRSWLFHSCYAMLKGWDQEWLAELIKHDAGGNFETRFPIMPTVYRLLSGKLMVEVRKEIAEHSMDGGLFVTIEAALWFTLLTVEARLEALWDHCKMSLEKKDGSPESGDMSTDKPEDLPAFSPTFGGFMAAWLELCRHVDPLSEIQTATTAFNNVIDAWRSDGTLTVREPPDIPERVAEALGHKEGSTMTKKDFYEWSESGERRKILERMIPWMQLRSFVLFSYLHCNGDSSAVAAAESNSLRVQVA